MARLEPRSRPHPTQVRVGQDPCGAVIDAGTLPWALPVAASAVAATAPRILGVRRRGQALEDGSRPDEGASHQRSSAQELAPRNPLFGGARYLNQQGGHNNCPRPQEQTISGTE